MAGSPHETNLREAFFSGETEREVGDRHSLYPHGYRAAIIKSGSTQQWAAKALLHLKTRMFCALITVFTKSGEYHCVFNMWLRQL